MIKTCNVRVMNNSGSNQPAGESVSRSPSLEGYTRNMEAMYKVYPHNPPHYFVPNAMYIVTGSVLYKKRLLFDDTRKALVLEILLERSAHWGWEMEAWAILENHYHFISRSPENPFTLEQLIGNSIPKQQ